MAGAVAGFADDAKTLVLPVGPVQGPRHVGDTGWRDAVGSRTLIMGVLNVTPDSFSDGGDHLDPSIAVDRGQDLVAAGADVVDVGGESTRPGARPVPADEEAARVLPVIRGLARAGVPCISIDTTKAQVAEQALEAGAHWVNDISGGTFDPPILQAAARAGAPIVLGHSRDRPDRMQKGAWTYEGGVVHAVRQALGRSVEQALEAGIRPHQLWLDPGIGFGKTFDENLELLRNLDALRTLGFPLLVGTSRKRFIGHLTGRPPRDRVFGTAASVALAIRAGADAVRIHDVEVLIDVVRVADAWVRNWRPEPDLEDGTG